MRYLSSILLALVVHVLLSIVVLMALACTATPTPTPTPAGPMYSEEEAIAVLKEHLQAKPVPIPGFPPHIACFSYVGGNSATWSAKYDNEGHRWDVRADSFIAGSPATPSPSGVGSIIDKLLGVTPEPQSVPIAYNWSVYERTKSIVAAGSNWMC